ncbi:MAG: MFS transporter [Acidobacteria bacterium]|nr:MFS transporter [Acidobacteriota bacterium]MBI3278689.1 MFS transporter [Acidobacteriota bacterium]
MRLERAGLEASPSVNTRVRYRVVGFLAVLAAITYFDRVCIATLAPRIMRDLGLGRVEMSYVFSAFTLAYAFFEIPSAWWGERIGTRKVLARIVIWWSLFTMATAAAWGFASMAVIRFLFGAGEAGAWPNAARTFSRWIPAGERGRVQGIFFMGAHFAGGIAPLLVAALEPRLGWRGVFLFFGVLGLVWAVWWLRWFRDEPSEHPSVAAEELRLIEKGRTDAASHSPGLLWKVLPRNRDLQALCASYFANGYGFYFLITWLPSYLEEQRGFSKAALSLFAGLPLLLSLFADVLGGVATDWLTRKFGIRAGRTAVGFAAYAVAAAAIFAAAFVSGATLAAVLIAVAAAMSMFTLAASWAACLDIGGPHAGIMSAAMNTSGQVGGILSPLVLAYIVEGSGDWRLPLVIMSALYAVGALAWLVVDPRRPLLGGERRTAATR